MNHGKALAIKFISSLALLYIVLGLLYDMSFRNVFLITLVLGISSYIIGDMLLLRRTNNMTATIADFVLALIVIWSMGSALTTGGSPFTMALIASIGVALFEYMFHKYVANNVFTDDNQEVVNNQRQSLKSLQYQTEVSEEDTPYSVDEPIDDEDQ